MRGVLRPGERGEADRRVTSLEDARVALRREIGGRARDDDQPAAGRLDDARPVVELLTTQDPGRAAFLASHLEALNQQRQQKRQEPER